MIYKQSEQKPVLYALHRDYIKVFGYGDDRKVIWSKTPETVKDWDEPMKSEMMGFYEERFPLVDCVVCGKPFRRIGNKITCSPECSHARANKSTAEYMRKKNNEAVECTCTICGKTFTKSRKQQKYTCSMECTKEFGRIHEGKVEKPRRKKKKDTLVELNREARDKGLTYGQLQAQKTLAEVGKIKW